MPIALGLLVLYSYLVYLLKTSSRSLSVGTTEA